MNIPRNNLCGYGHSEKLANDCAAIVAGHGGFPEENNPYPPVKYILESYFMSNIARDGWDNFLNIVRGGAEYINVHVRKDGKEYHYQGDFLSHMEKEEITE